MTNKNLLTAAATALFLGATAPAAWAAGAIAVYDEAETDPSDVGYGVGFGETREEAAAEAMSECRKAGNAQCKVAVRFDSCGAYAASKQHYGVGWGENLLIAEANALAQCGANCQIVVSDCDD